MMSLTFGLFTQVSGSGTLGPLVLKMLQKSTMYLYSLKHHFACPGSYFDLFVDLPQCHIQGEIIQQP